MAHKHTESHLGAPVTRVVTISVPAEAVWRLMASPGILASWHPFCKENRVDRWPGVGARDTIEYYSGLTLTRTFINWIDGAGYDLNAIYDDGGESPVTWRLRPEGEGLSTLEITIQPYVAEPTARKRAQMDRLIARYLELTMKGIKYYLETGAPVARNQFGSHPMFSPSVSQG